MDHTAARLYYILATIFEFLLVTALIAVFVGAYQQEYRTLLWQLGGIRGWNSDPHSRVYDYANYREPPPVPLIWDETWQQYHLYVAIVSGIAWIARARIQFYGLDIVGRLGTNVIYDLILAALWAYSAVLQNSSDVSDPAHLSLRPWYLVRDCREGAQEAFRACEVLKWSYTLTMLAVMWFCIRVVAVLMYSAYLHGFDNGSKRAKSLR